MIWKHIILPLKYIWFLIIPLFLYIFAAIKDGVFLFKKNNPLSACCVVARAIVVKSKLLKLLSEEKKELLLIVSPIVGIVW